MFSFLKGRILLLKGLFRELGRKRGKGKGGKNRRRKRRENI